MLRKRSRVSRLSAVPLATALNFWGAMVINGLGMNEKALNTTS